MITNGSILSLIMKQLLAVAVASLAVVQHDELVTQFHNTALRLFGYFLMYMTKLNLLTVRATFFRESYIWATFNRESYIWVGWGFATEAI